MADLDATLDKALGLKLVTIRLPADMVDDFKLLAAVEGVKYQALMRNTLNLYRNERLREIARERLTRKPR